MTGHGFTAPAPDPDRTTPLYRRLAAESRDNDTHRRTVLEAQANHRDSGAPMWEWLTGRGTPRSSTSPGL